MTMTLTYGGNPLTRGKFNRTARVQTNVSANNLDPFIVNALMGFSSQSVELEIVAQSEGSGILWFTEIQESSHPRTAVEAVEYIKSTLQCSLEEVLES